MAKRNRLIPFSWLPANWGLEGTRKKLAMAEYYWTGEDLDYMLLDINYTDVTKKEYQDAKLELDRQYSKISENEYLKTRATLSNQAYFNAEAVYIPEESGISIEYDYNDIFVEILKNMDWPGITDEEIVNNWFTSVNRKILSEDSYTLQTGEMP